MKKPLIIFLFGSFIITNCKATGNSFQTVNAVNDSLKIGKLVPDINIGAISNYEKPTAKISDFKGKLLILDFWNTTCTSCIAAMSEMEMLQKKFNDKIQIILVTKSKAADIKKLKTNIVRNNHLPMITDDTVLSGIFPYKTVPTHVWIDEKGLFNQKTTGYNTSAKNIQAHLDGKDVKLPLKREKMDFDHSVPTWLEGNGRQLEHLKYYSFIMSRITDTNRGGVRWERDRGTHKIYRIEILNQPVLEMYKCAFNGDTSETFSPNNRIVMKVKNPGQYFRPDEPDLWDSWWAENAYVYDIKVPLETAPYIFDMMKQDLDRFFSLHGRIEKQKIKCLVLKRISKLDLLHTKGGTSGIRKTDAFSKDISFLNMPLETSIFHSLVFANRENPLPIINDTHYPGNIDMEIHSKFSDIPAIRKELQAYGLDLVEGYRNIDMLIITDDVKPIDKSRSTKIK